MTASATFSSMLAKDLGPSTALVGQKPVELAGHGGGMAFWEHRLGDQTVLVDDRHQHVPLHTRR